MRIHHLATLAAVFMFAAAHAATTVPENLRPAPNETLTLETKATGVQIYTCSASKDNATRYEWTFKAPEAELFDPSGARVGKHYAGPTWESIDGSLVVGEVKARDNGPDASAIPWLLLGAKSNSGNGMMGKVTSVQRVDTKGGKAPTDGCDVSQSGKEVRVPYTATYYFYSAK